MLPGGTLIDGSVRCGMALDRARNHHVLASGTDYVGEGPLSRSTRVAVVHVMRLLLLGFLTVREDLRVLGLRTRARLALHVPLLAAMVLLCDLHVPLVVIKGRRVRHLVYLWRIHRAVQALDLRPPIEPGLRRHGDPGSRIRDWSELSRLLPRVILLRVVAESPSKLALHLLVAIVYQVRRVVPRHLSWAICPHIMLVLVADDVLLHPVPMVCVTLMMLREVGQSAGHLLVHLRLVLGHGWMDYAGALDVDDVGSDRADRCTLKAVRRRMQATCSIIRRSVLLQLALHSDLGLRLRASYPLPSLGTAGLREGSLLSAGRGWVMALSQRLLATAGGLALH